MMDSHSGWMSPVVLQELPTLVAHSHTFYSPQLHIEKKMGFPVSFKAFDITWYLILEEIPRL